MNKEFNITGVCLPSQHYMADISGKLRQVMELVERGKYFIINRPRQYGKTTMLFRLTEALNRSGNYLAFVTSFEGLGDAAFQDEKQSAHNFSIF